MIITEKVKIKIDGNNIKHYISKGLTNIKMKDIVEIHPSLLPKYSKIIIHVKCDVCATEKQIIYKEYYNNYNWGEHNLYCCCRECSKVKFKLTSQKLYGTDNPFQNIEVKEKIKQTCKEKYGTEYANQSDIVKEKIKNSFTEKYGGFPFSSDELMKRIKETNIKNCGYDNPTKSPEVIKKRKENYFKNTGYYHQMYNDEIKKVVSDKLTINWLNSLKVRYPDLKIISFDFEKRLLKVNCKKGHDYEIDHNTIYNRTVNKSCLCTICNTIISNKSISSKELELREFFLKYFTEDELIFNSRKIINPYEIDIFIPKLNLAIEYNGIYWHSEHIIDKDYHKNKYNLCKTKGIKLLHIFEDSYINNNELVLYKLKEELNLIQYKQSTYLTKFSKLNKDIYKFININELNGFNINIYHYFYLYNNEEILSLIAYRKVNGIYYVRVINLIEFNLTETIIIQFKMFLNIDTVYLETDLSFCNNMKDILFDNIYYVKDSKRYGYLKKWDYLIYGTGINLIII